MTSPNSDAPVLAGTRGVGSAIQLGSYPKHSTTKRLRTRKTTPSRDDDQQCAAQRLAMKLLLDAHIASHEPCPPRVRLFLGALAIAQATAWCTENGPGTAMALPDGIDPRSMHWPAVALLKVVQGDSQTEPLSRLTVLAHALRRAGVGYAAFDHLVGWTNLWLYDCSEGGA